MKKLLDIPRYRPIINYRLFRRFSVQNNSFHDDFEQNHIETNLLQRTLLSVGSAVVSIVNPYRGDMIACLGETTGDNAARYVLNKMQQSDEGSKILVDKPRINTRTVDMQYLAQLPDGTIGKTYSNFLNENKVTPDSRIRVQFIDDPELAYVVQRYREVHDLIHTVLQMRTNMLGEVTVKWVEAIQTKFPMCIGGAIFGPIRLLPKHRQLYLKHYLPWAVKTGTNAEFLLNIYFENRWEQPLTEFYAEMKIEPLF